MAGLEPSTGAGRVGGERRRGPVPLGVGRAIEPIYRAVIDRRNRRWDAGVGVTRLPIPVISVGNLSVGGTGKTPMVVHLVRVLQSAGRRPCVAMRGYVRSFHLAGGQPGETVRSDEARMYEYVLPGVPVVAQPDRAAGVRALIAGGAAVDCVVMDDGFQHRRLHRDLDVVLVDASRSPFDDRLLPAGWLREGPESLRRAGAVVITHAEMVDAREVERLHDRVRGVNPSVPVAVARHEWTGLRFSDGREEPVEWLRDRKVVAVCAIGNPAGFLRGVWMHGAREADEIVLPDHDPYRPATVRRVIDAAKRHGAEAIVTTEKDWAKLREGHGGAGVWPCTVVRPRLEMRFLGGQGELERVVIEAAEQGRDNAEHRRSHT